MLALRPAILALIGVLFVYPTASAQDTWINSLGGDWNTALNWDTATVPNAADATAIFGTDPTGDSTIDVSAAVTVGTIRIDNTTNSSISTANGSGITFDVSSGSAGIEFNAGGWSIGNDLSLSDPLTVSVGSSGTLSGVISGANSLTKTGTGTLILSGANTYTGATTVNDGTLRLGGANERIDDASAMTVASGATFDLNSFNETIGSLSGAGSVTLGSGTLTAGGDNSSTTFSGVISGSGAVVKQGTGTWTLTGANTYSGGTTVTGGVLQGNTTSLQGNITNNASVVFDQAADGTYSNVISGTGSVTKQNTGILTFSGANTYTGATTVNGGTLRLGGANERIDDSSAMTVASAATFDLNGFNETIGSLSGAGSVTLGSGTLTAGGDNSSTTFSGAISGTGAVVKQGTGTWTLTGANTYSGGTTVSGGVLQGNTTSLQGDITNNASVVFAQAADGTYSGVISGTGSVTKQNTGRLTFSGDSTYTGATTVNAGRLDVNGSLASAVTVSSLAVLGGTGTLGGATIKDGGTIAPGNSIGITTIDGDFTQSSGSTFEVEIANPPGTTPGVNNDQIVVTGTATIDNATVDVQADLSGDPQGDDYPAGITYTILKADGGVTVLNGGYATVTDNLILRDAVIIHRSNDVLLQLVRVSGSLASAALTDNQLSMATALDIVGPTATGDVGDLLDALTTASDPVKRRTLDQLSGEAHASAVGTSFQLVTSGFVQTVSGRLRRIGSSLSGGSGSPLVADPLDEIIVRGQNPVQLAGYQTALGTLDGGSSSGYPSDYRSWVLWFGHGGDIQNDGNAVGLNYGMGGTVFGVERQIGSGLLLGLLGSHSVANVDLDRRPDRADIDNYQVGGYGYYAGDPLYGMGLVTYGRDDYETSRLTPAGRARADFDADELIAYAETGMNLNVSGFLLQPIAALQYVLINQPGFTEEGAGGLALRVRSKDSESLRAMLGARLARPICGRHCRWLVPELHARWMREMANDNHVITAGFVGAPGADFVVRGADVGRDFGLFGGGLSAEVNENLSLFASYDLQVSPKQTGHVGSGGATVLW